MEIIIAIFLSAKSWRRDGFYLLHQWVGAIANTIVNQYLVQHASH
jgi:hypothetical protein